MGGYEIVEAASREEALAKSRYQEGGFLQITKIHIAANLKEPGKPQTWTVWVDAEPIEEPPRNG